ncbi:MAG: DUF6361 family protein [Eubacteriales bacterium]
MQLGWIDFSREERNKVLAALQLLGEHLALDELGIGYIRDAYADILFPGISTIQTRAKYFVLIPYIFGKAEKEKFTRGREVMDWVNRYQDKLVPTLIENSELKANGIIGREALRQKRTVKNKPTSIYWGGLRTFEIVRNSGLSLSQACQISFEKSQKRKETELLDGDEAYDDKTANQGDQVIFSPILPGYDLENATGIELTRDEAQFLYGKITTASKTKNTLMAFMLKEKKHYSGFFEIDTEILPPQIKQDYLLSRSFADFIEGAHLRYNVIYSGGEDPDMKRGFEDWRTGFDFEKFDADAVYQRINCPKETKSFCENFAELIQSGDMESVDELLVAREKNVKQDRSKLRKPADFHYKAVHEYKLDFRFFRASVIMDDILRGLGENV